MEGGLENPFVILCVKEDVEREEEEEEEQAV
jgi:hypothetical protein